MDVGKTLRFGSVGLIGFLVDAGSLYLLLALSSMGPFYARLIAIVLALTFTWFLNRTLTFDPSGRTVAAEIASYSLVGISGSLLNYGIYALVILIYPAVWPLLALILASIIVTVFSWIGYSKFVFQN